MTQYHPDGTGPRDRSGKPLRGARPMQAPKRDAQPDTAKANPPAKKTKE